MMELAGHPQVNSDRDVGIGRRSILPSEKHGKGSTTWEEEEKVIILHVIEPQSGDLATKSLMCWADGPDLAHSGL
ncbi:hypothetical protein GW17_00057077 [Ensete ventricosum]|nr:hypothetical protein GW17_00057077 [Ensete ventricosum]